MGERYYLELKCAYCGKKQNKDVYYAPTSNLETFKCDKCMANNFITANFQAKKIEEVAMEDIKLGFESTTNVSWTDDEIKRMCRERLRELKEM